MSYFTPSQYARQFILATLASPQATNNEYDCPKSTADCLDPNTNASLCTHVIRSVFRGRDMLKRGSGWCNQRCHADQAFQCDYKTANANAIISDTAILRMYGER